VFGVEQCDLCGPIQSDEPVPYPIKQKKASKQNKTSILFIIESSRNPDGLRKYLLTKRPDQGLLANMWVFPCLDIEDGGANGAPTQQSKTEFLSKFNIHASRCRAIGSFTHLYTHISQTYQVEFCSCETASDTMYSAILQIIFIL
jgi:A/G-specific adenine glycosylase